MTTESTSDTRRPGATVLLGAAAGALAVVLVLVLVAALVHGGPGARGAAIGGGLALAVFGVGTAVVHVVAGMLPAASMLVALMTYTLQVAVMALVVIGLSQSGLLADAASRGWFASAVITTTAGWLAAQVWQATHLRLPAYEPAVQGPAPGPARTAGRAPEAGA